MLCSTFSLLIMSPKRFLSLSRLVVAGVILGSSQYTQHPVLPQVTDKMNSLVCLRHRLQQTTSCTWTALPTVCAPPATTAPPTLAKALPITPCPGAPID
ncbi:hypothetical protein B0O80DRAFT_287628 [Mortierella sp. GBAus27b]|nr:hypothetical protein B0O80DRAFT_287628 [Mortierella sp. GBAus27b]